MRGRSDRPLDTLWGGSAIANDLSLYDAWAEEWWSMQHRHLRILHGLVRPRMATFTKVVGSFEGMRVLEVGCGGGFQSEALARAGATVTGLDLSAPAIEAARRHAEAEQLAITYLEGSADRLPGEDRSFDAVVCVDVLEHLDGRPHRPGAPDILGPTLHEIARVLRPGGHFLYDTLSRTHLARLLAIRVAEDWLGWVPRGTHDWDLLLSPEVLELALVAVGLEPRGRHGLGPVWLDRHLDPIFVRVPTTAVLWVGWARRRD